ncbi:hypothetical protein PLCT1_01847 [Planctomycetaceae bacterium]|nr:hypothetical protein PLCT1_01847 [Planctomycetaceae bacterium]
MDWQLTIIIAAVTLAAAFVLWRTIATFTKKDCNECGCGKAAKRA